MASIPCVLIVLLICWTQDHTGVRGETPTVFSSVGQNATLSCDNVVHPDCSNTAWIYSGGRTAVELVMLGKINKCTDPNSDECKRAKRLSLHSGCSLHITEVTTDDVGYYTCRQYEREGGHNIIDDAPVRLSVLSVSMSPKVTEMQAGSHVTLHCVLHTYDHCGGSVGDKGVRLSWVDMRGTELKNTTKRQIRTTSLCNITLTEELRDPHHNKTNWKWKCQLTAGQDKVFANYTIKNKDFKPTSSSTSVSKSSTPKTAMDTPSNSSGFKPFTTSAVSTPKSTTSGSDSCPSLHSSSVHVAVKLAATISLFVAVIIVVVIHRKRSGDPQGKPNTSAPSVG